MRDLILTVLAVVLTVPVGACALIPLVQDLAARRQTRREASWLAQWRADHTHTQTAKEPRS